MQRREIHSFHLFVGGSYKTLYPCSGMPRSRSSWVVELVRYWMFFIRTITQIFNSHFFINWWPGPSILQLWLVSSRQLFIINLTSIMCFVNVFLLFSFFHLTYTLSRISYTLCECFFTGLIIYSSSLSEAFLVFSPHVCVFFKCRLWSDIVGCWTSVVVMSPSYADLAFTNLFNFLPKYT